MQTEFGDLTRADDEEGDVSDDDAVELDDEGDDVDSVDDTVVFAKGTDNVGELSVEINVEELIAEFESSADSEAARKKEIRRRLDEIREQKEAMRELEDTFAFDPNEDD